MYEKNSIPVQIECKNFYSNGDSLKDYYCWEDKFNIMSDEEIIQDLLSQRVDFLIDNVLTQAIEKTLDSVKKEATRQLIEELKKLGITKIKGKIIRM